MVEGVGVDGEGEATEEHDVFKEVPSFDLNRFSFTPSIFSSGIIGGGGQISVQEFSSKIQVVTFQFLCAATRSEK